MTMTSLKTMEAISDYPSTPKRAPRTSSIMTSPRRSPRFKRELCSSDDTTEERVILTKSFYKTDSTYLNPLERKALGKPKTLEHANTNTRRLQPKNQTVSKPARTRNKTQVNRRITRPRSLPTPTSSNVSPAVSKRQVTISPPNNNSTLANTKLKHTRPVYMPPSPKSKKTSSKVQNVTLSDSENDFLDAQFDLGSFEASKKLIVGESPTKTAKETNILGELQTTDVVFNLPVKNSKFEPPSSPVSAVGSARRFFKNRSPQRVAKHLKEVFTVNNVFQYGSGQKKKKMRPLKKEVVKKENKRSRKRNKGKNNVPIVVKRNPALGCSSDSINEGDYSNFLRRSTRTSISLGENSVRQTASPSASQSSSSPSLKNATKSSATPTVTRNRNPINNQATSNSQSTSSIKTSATEREQPKESNVVDLTNTDSDEGISVSETSQKQLVNSPKNYVSGKLAATVSVISPLSNVLISLSTVSLPESGDANKGLAGTVSVISPLSNVLVSVSTVSLPKSGDADKGLETSSTEGVPNDNVGIASAVSDSTTDELDETGNKIKVEPTNPGAEKLTTRLFPVFTKPSETHSEKRLASSRDYSPPSKRHKLSREDQGMEQLVIDAGQKDLGPKTCNTCGMLFSTCSSDDDELHRKHHAYFLGNLYFKGWTNENVISIYDNGRVLMIRPSDPVYMIKKVNEVREIVDRDLGFVDHHLPKSKAAAYYFYVSDEKRIVGCLIADAIDKAYQLLPSKTSDKTPGAIYCSNESVPAVCGVNRIWCAPKWRRRQVASRLMDCLRFSFCSHMKLSVKDFAFSSPTISGREFAAKYTKMEQFLVYT